VTICGALFCLAMVQATICSTLPGDMLVGGLVYGLVGATCLRLVGVLIAGLVGVLVGP
jgi:hypothetical protein